MPCRKTKHEVMLHPNQWVPNHVRLFPDIAVFTGVIRSEDQIFAKSSSVKNYRSHEFADIKFLIYASIILWSLQHAM